MPESVDELTTLRIDCEGCPIAPGRRCARLDMQATVTLREADAATSVWRDQPADDGTEMTVSSDDERLHLQRPRVLALRVPAGVPAEPGVYEMVAELTHDGDTVQWPPTPQRVEFKQ